MRLEELFTNLGTFAGTVAAQLHEASHGVPLAELDLTGAAPHEIALTGPAHVIVRGGDVLRITVDPGTGADEVRFALGGARLRIAGGDCETVVRVTVPAPRKIAVAGRGRLSAAALADDGALAIAGSGSVELERAGGSRLEVNIAGSGRAMVNGRSQALALSIGGSGSFDGDGLVAQSAEVSIAGSGNAIFGCEGEVTANLMGSGNVIVRGSARCTVSSVGSGTLVCERAPADA